MALVGAYLVIVIHCISTFKVDNPVLWRFGYSGFCCLAVPFFFLASGFFLGGHVQERGWWRRETAKRCRTLLVPYFFWLTTFFLYRMAFLVLAGRTAELTPAAMLTAFGFNPFDYPVLRPLWFVRTLFLLVLVSPALVWMSRRLGVLSLLLLFPLGDPFFFAFGLAFGMGLVDLRLDNRRATVAALTGTVLMLVCGLCPGTWEPYGAWAGKLALPFLVLGAMNLVPAVALPDSVASTAFPIYLFHMFVVSLLGTLVRGRYTGVVSRPVILLLVAAGVFAVSMLVTMALRWGLPRWRGLLWGGR